MLANHLPEEKQSILNTMQALDQGKIRVCEKTSTGWVTHAWIKQAILLYFALRPLEAALATSSWM